MLRSTSLCEQLTKSIPFSYNGNILWLIDEYFVTSRLVQTHQLRFISSSTKCTKFGISSSGRSSNYILIIRTRVKRNGMLKLIPKLSFPLCYLGNRSPGTGQILVPSVKLHDTKRWRKRRWGNTREAERKAIDIFFHQNFLKEEHSKGLFKKSNSVVWFLGITSVRIWLVNSFLLKQPIRTLMM